MRRRRGLKGWLHRRGGPARRPAALANLEAAGRRTEMVGAELECQCQWARRRDSEVQRIGARQLDACSGTSGASRPRPEGGQARRGRPWQQAARERRPPGRAEPGDAGSGQPLRTSAIGGAEALRAAWRRAAPCRFAWRTRRCVDVSRGRPGLGDAPGTRPCRAARRRSCRRSGAGTRTRGSSWRRGARRFRFRVRVAPCEAAVEGGIDAMQAPAREGRLHAGPGPGGPTPCRPRPGPAARNLPGCGVIQPPLMPALAGTGTR